MSMWREGGGGSKSRDELLCVFVEMMEMEVIGSGCGMRG